MPLAIRQHVFQVDVQIVTVELRGAGSDPCLPRPAVPLAAEPANSQFRSGRGPLNARASCLPIDFRAHIRARVSARWSSCQKPTALIGTDTSPRCSRIPLVQKADDYAALCCPETFDYRAGIGTHSSSAQECTFRLFSRRWSQAPSNHPSGGI